jgi:hypothetical protein
MHTYIHTSSAISYVVKNSIAAVEGILFRSPDPSLQWDWDLLCLSCRRELIHSISSPSG